MYSEKVMDHFRNPRNQGDIPNASGIGEVGNPVCHDMMSIYIKVEDDIITDIKFKTFGCGAAIATSSMITELAKGKSLGEAQKISQQDVMDALGGLPDESKHCALLSQTIMSACSKALGSNSCLSSASDPMQVRCNPGCSQSARRKGSCAGVVVTTTSLSRTTVSTLSTVKTSTPSSSFISSATEERSDTPLPGTRKPCGNICLKPGRTLWCWITSVRGARSPTSMWCPSSRRCRTIFHSLTRPRNP